MRNITTLEALRVLHGPVGSRSARKELSQLDAHAARFIGLSPFVVLSSANATGAMDASPRGGAPGFAKVLDNRTVLIPDAPGNNRLDTLENIVQTGQIGLLFLLPGMDETLRVNGSALLSTDPADLALCADERRTPKLVIRVTVHAMYLHCAKALMRSALWDPGRHIERSSMPSLGEMLRDQIDSTLHAETQEAMVRRYNETL